MTLSYSRIVCCINHCYMVYDLRADPTFMLSNYPVPTQINDTYKSKYQKWHLVYTLPRVQLFQTVLQLIARDESNIRDGNGCLVCSLHEQADVSLCSLLILFAQHFPTVPTSDHIFCEIKAKSQFIGLHQYYTIIQAIYCLFTCFRHKYTSETANMRWKQSISKHLYI